jgi:hypothetical protein
LRCIDAPLISCDLRTGQEWEAKRCRCNLVCE